MKIEIKTLFGSVLFEYDCEENTILKTLIKAVEGKKDLTGADLTGANLRGADLGGAYLGGAYLTGANLTGAYLTGAYLRGADLTGAYLRGADLRENEKIQKAAVFSGLYNYIVIPYITETGEKRVKMGCHNRTLVEWETDFWNNTSEFPNDGSEKSMFRVMAFETAKKWFKIVSPENTKSQ